MKKIISLFKRNYGGDRLVYDEVVPGAEWGLDGCGIATGKFDGTACMLDTNHQLHKRYDRKLTKAAQKIKKRHRGWVPSKDHFKPAPDGWMPVEIEPDLHTGHWPGWLLVDYDKPENKWHKEAIDNFWEQDELELYDYSGTYELVGPKIQGNPYKLDRHVLWEHGSVVLWDKVPLGIALTFNIIKGFLKVTEIEGIVWHHPDGRYCKIKRSDFGFDWPVK